MDAIRQQGTAQQAVQGTAQRRGQGTAPAPHHELS